MSSSLLSVLIGLLPLLLFGGLLSIGIRKVPLSQAAASGAGRRSRSSMRSMRSAPAAMAAASAAATSGSRP